MSANGRCPYCGSDNIERYKTIAWKCLNCGRVFYIPLAVKVATEEVANDAVDSTAASEVTKSETPEES